MRKMQKYIVKDNRIFVGLEDSKRQWKVCVRCEGMIVNQASMPTDYKNLRNYFMNRFPGCEVQVMYEAGFQGFWLYDLLEADGFDCIVTPPNKVTQEKNNKVKNDKIDARRLALNLENGDYKSCHIPDKERRNDRQISRTLDQIQKEIVRTKNRIRRFLDFHGLNDGMPSGRWGPGEYERARGLKLDVFLQIPFDTYFQLLDELTKIRYQLIKKLHIMCRKKRYRVSVNVKKNCPGVGWLSAIRFTLEWGEMSRFTARKRFSSFTGLTSSEYSTGDTVRRGRITGQSSERVRAWLVQCAWRAIKVDPVLLNKYQRVLKNSGNNKKKAIVAVAHKLAVRMRAMELNEETYRIGVIE